MIQDDDAFYMQQAAFARRLVDACKSNKDAAAEAEISEGMLSKYCAPQYRCVMPMRTVMTLQAYCGRPVYTDAVSGLCRGTVGELRDDTLQIIEDSTAILAAVRLMPSDARRSPRMREALHRLVATAKDHLDRVDRDIEEGV